MGKSEHERGIHRHPRGSENHTKKNELARMGMEPMAFGLALRNSNHDATDLYTLTTTFNFVIIALKTNLVASLSGSG